MEDRENDVLARIASLEAGISGCELCPRACRVDRRAGEEGFCRTGASPRIASAGPHFGEEAPLVGRNGSGTVFLSGLLVRHLVMPGGAPEGVAVIDFLADHVSPRVAINVMGQYRPCFEAHSMPGIDRRPDPREIAAVRDHAVRRGLRLL